MIRSQLFRRHFAIAAATVLLFVSVGASLSVVFMRNLAQRPMGEPSIFIARLIKEFGPTDPVSGLQKVELLHGSNASPMQMAILDENLEVVAGESSLALPARSLPRPGAPYEISQEEHSHPGPPPLSLIRLDYDPPKFLVLSMADRPRPPPFLRLFPPAFFTLVFTVLVGIAAALYLIFRSLRDHVNTADRVITELQSGNLKARFPVRKQDEIGGAMTRFNRMADEIEQLVLRLQATETSRNFLLQELAHDLRTPVASLRSLLETVFGELKMSESLQELSELSLKEVDYISRLVEDLLLLSRVSDTKYKPPRSPFDLAGVFREEGESLAIRRSGEITFTLKAPSNEIMLTGEEQLMQRLARNALENAFSFARGHVEAEIVSQGKEVRILVRDDGPGFDAESLSHFGERRAQRSFAKASGGRLSLGLGSVIMKTITAIHRGHIQARNRPQGGAEIEIVLPLHPGAN